MVVDLDIDPNAEGWVRIPWGQGVLKGVLLPLEACRKGETRSAQSYPMISFLTC